MQEFGNAGADLDSAFFVNGGFYSEQIFNELAMAKITTLGIYRC